jgi:hypothetical protein
MRNDVKHVTHNELHGMNDENQTADRHAQEFPLLRYPECWQNIIFGKIEELYPVNRHENEKKQGNELASQSKGPLKTRPKLIEEELKLDVTGTFEGHTDAHKEGPHVGDPHHFQIPFDRAFQDISKENLHQQNNHKRNGRRETDNLRRDVRISTQGLKKYLYPMS